LRVLVTVIIVLITFIFQATVFHEISIFGVRPDFTIAVVVSLGILLGKDRGAIVGLASGMLQDIVFGKPVGISALSYTLVGYLVGINSEKIFKENIVVPVVFTLGATILRHTVVIFFNYALNVSIPILYYIKKVIALETVYNCIVVIFIYKLLHTIYHKKFMQEGFKMKRSR
jgi:rod shape-determining protein MreD